MVRVAPFADEWYIDLGLAYYAQTYFPPALEAFEQAAELDPDLAVAHNNICSVQAALGRGDEAIRSCTKALELDPEFQLAQVVLLQSILSKYDT